MYNWNRMPPPRRVSSVLKRLSHNLLETRLLNVILIRHAESTNNTLSHTPLAGEVKRLRESDCGLSERGKLQLQYLHNFVKDRHWREVYHSKTKIYSSPMLRCLETTFSITSAMHLSSSCLPTVCVHPNLFEYGGCYTYSDDRSTQAHPGLNQIDVESRYHGFKCLEGVVIYIKTQSCYIIPVICLF